MTQYTVDLRDVTGVRVAEFHGAGRGRTKGGLTRLLYRREARGVGTFRLDIAGDDSRIPLFERDGQIIIKRYDPFWESAFAADFEGFHRVSQWTQDMAGILGFISAGPCYNVMLPSETINWPAGSAYTCKRGPAETVAKEFVEENIGPSAGLDQEGNTRVRQGLTVQATAGGGAAWDGCRSYDNLMDVVLELAEYGPGDFWIAGTGAATFEFRWKSPRRGEDKTRGNDPAVVFSAFGPGVNITGLALLDSRVSDVNVCHALGWGEGEARVCRTRSTADVMATPWSRSVVSRDARDASSTDQLDDRADEELDRSRSRMTAMFRALQTSATRYKRDWDIGDLVTLELKPGTEYEMKVASVEIQWESEGAEVITTKLEEE